jgi:hypothetical protein
MVTTTSGNIFTEKDMKEFALTQLCRGFDGWLAVVPVYLFTHQFSAK